MISDEGVKLGEEAAINILVYILLQSSKLKS
jgi:hypothetical protein